MPFTQLRDFHLYLHTPTVVMKARVNLPGGATYPITTIPFDTVSVGAYTDVAPDSFFIIGSADGLDDRGRGRVQNVLTSTNLPVGRLSRGTHDGEIDVYDNDFITFYNDFRVHAKIPYDAPDGIDYKDSNVLVGDYLTTDMPPVANCGPGFADYINPITGVITVTLDGSASYAMADGATIVTFAWDTQGGTVVGGDIDEAIVTIEYEPGFRWPSLTVIDSNGTPHTTRCPVLAVDPDNDPTIKFQVESHRIEMRGQTIGFRLLDNLSRTTFPDGGLVLFWADAPIDPTDRSHMLFQGWHQSDSFSIRATPTGLVRDTILNCVDVAGRLATLPGFPQALERNAVEARWYNMPTLDMRKCLHYLAFWHSTALSLADFLLPDSLSDYPAMRLDSTGASLYEQINSRAQSCVPDHWLTCNIQGQLLVKPDWMLLDFDDRPVDTAGTFTEDYWSDIRADYTRPPRVYVLNSSAVVCSTTWLMLGGEETLPLAFCKAPGTAFGQGVSEATTGEKLTISQEQLNACEGHRYARLNARYGPFTIVEPTGDIQEFQPAHMLPVQVNISAATAAQRGLDFTTARGLVKSIDMRYNHTEQGTWVQPTVQWEREVVGLPAVTHIPEVPDDPDYEVPEPPPATVPPDFGLIEGQQLVAGVGNDGWIYRTSDFQTVSGSGGPTWTRVDTTIADTIYSFVVDPFSPGYINGAGAINGWIVNDTAIYRVTDLFGTVVATSVYTFAEPTVAANYHWRTIQASFGAFFAEGSNPWLLCVSYYDNSEDHPGTWATRSTDGGLTWSAEVQISALYDGDMPVRANPIGVYASPKTAGLAYTAAHVDPQPVGAPDVVWIRYNGSTGSINNVGWMSSITCSAFENAGDPGTAQQADDLIIAPHPDVHRIVVKGRIMGRKTKTGSGSGVSAFDTHGSGIATQTLQDIDWIAPADNEATVGAFTVEWTKGSAADWPTNSVTALTLPTPTTGCRLEPFANANASSGTFETITSVQCYVAEMEMEDSTIYTFDPDTVKGFVSSDWGATWAQSALIMPGQAQAGTIHLPWILNAAEDLAYFGYLDKTTNRQFKLKQSVAGTITDISPIATLIAYGPNRYGFAIRAYDSDRQFLAVGGVGNDASALPADDKVGLFVSSNAGVAWTNILAPVAISNALNGLEIAFSGDSSNVLFAWGGWSNAASLSAIYYSSNFGSTLDSREGNINSLGTVAFLGIAGGPTP